MNDNNNKKIERKRLWGTVEKVAFMKLRAGGSPLTVLVQDESRLGIARIRSMIFSLVVRLNEGGYAMKVMTRRVVGGIRVWRIE